MILSLFILALATIVIVVSIFEFLAQHLSPFLELALPCRTTFAFVISPFIAGGFPAFESLSHIAVKIRLALLYQKNYSIASNLSPIDIPKKVFEKYKMALINPRRSPLAPLQKGGTGLLVPLLKGDLGGSTT